MKNEDAIYFQKCLLFVDIWNLSNVINFRLTIKSETY